jgi:hypothetical protein
MIEFVDNGLSDAVGEHGVKLSWDDSKSTFTSLLKSIHKQESNKLKKKAKSTLVQFSGKTYPSFFPSSTFPPSPAPFALLVGSVSGTDLPHMPEPASLCVWLTLLTCLARQRSARHR